MKEGLKSDECAAGRAMDTSLLNASGVGPFDSVSNCIIISMDNHLHSVRLCLIFLEPKV